jgi:hypothetical protein
MEPDKLKNALEIIKKLQEDGDPTIEVFIGKGKAGKPLGEYTPEEIYDMVMKWGTESKRGLLCGIYGCTEQKLGMCLICEGFYCLEHSKLHSHENKTGMILQKVEIDD